MKKSEPERAPGPVLTTYPCGEMDILAAFLDWHLEVVQVPLILALDVTPPEDPDAIAEVARILNSASRAHPGRVIWRRSLETRDSRSPLWQNGDTWAQVAISEYAASWIIHIDIDEFLVIPDHEPISLLLERASACGYSVLPLRRYTMTGKLPRPYPCPRPNDIWSALELMQVRVDQQTSLSRAQMIDSALDPLGHPLPVAFPFVDVGPHLAVQSSALTPYSMEGGHRISPSHGETALPHSFDSNPGAPYILTWPTRSRAHFDRKIDSCRAFLSANHHLELPMLWHWRRLVSLADNYDPGIDFIGAEYRAQFIDPLSAPPGALSLDRTVADWMAGRITR